MRSGHWKPKKRTLSRSSLRYQSWNVFLSIFGVFAKSAKPLKYRACQQKQGLGPLRCGSRWNLKKHRKCDGFRDPWTSGWPWNGGSRSLWTSSWLWNGGVGCPWTSSWPWMGSGTGSKWVLGPVLGISVHSTSSQVPILLSGFLYR